MVHRIAHCTAHGAGKDLHTGALTRIQSALIFGAIGGGLLACAPGSFIYDIWQVVGH
jgi:hypothetical protein